MLRDVIVPLRSSRSHVVEANIAEETGTQYQRRTFKFENVAVVIVEGIFLFKQDLREYFDLRVWIACSFSTALARALGRSQEGLPPAATIRAYDAIYFPAQRIHMDHDNPRDSADLIVNNAPTDWNLDASTILERKEFWEALDRCLSKLPERTAMAFTLREIDGLSSEEVCDVLNVSQNNLWVMLHRARMQLRNSLEARLVS